MKTYVKRLSVIFPFTVFLVLILLFVINRTYKKSVIINLKPNDQIVNQVSQTLPVRLIISSINVNAFIQQIGVISTGQMDVPNNITDVGWFKLGPHPGENGSAVIAGHFNGKNGEAGVFTNLEKLKTGDKLSIENENGTIINFIVRETRLYDPGYAEEVFSSNDAAHLNLITCDGVWDGVNKSYTKRLVVFTDLSQ